MYQSPLGLGGMPPQFGALQTGVGQVPGVSPLGKQAPITASPYSKQAPIAASPWGKQAPVAASPWGKPAPAVAPASCSIMYGPVANVCKSAVPVTQQMPVTTTVPVTTQMPITTVTPIPTGVTPQVYAAPGMGAYGKGVAPTSGLAPLSKAPLRPGAYTTEAAAIL